MDGLHSLELWGRGSESHSRHGCLCEFIVFLLFCVGNGLATGWSPLQGVLTTVLVLRNRSERKCFTDALCLKEGAAGKRERENGVDVTRRTVISNNGFIAQLYRNKHIGNILKLMQVKSSYCVAYNIAYFTCLLTAIYRRIYFDFLSAEPLQRCGGKWI
jgi:hypothetical protein